MTKAMYSGKDLTQTATIIRDKDTKKASIEITKDTKWTLYAGTSIENIDFSTPVANGTTKGTFPLIVPDSVRSYFQLVTPEGKAILAERHLPMTGGFNFRDLGGYKTKDGHYVAWGKIFRSDDLYNLTDKDLKYLSSIPIVSIVDFRATEEISAAPDKLPYSTEKDYVYSITPGNMQSLVAESKNYTSDDFANMMKELNKLLVTDTASLEQYRKFFRLLSSEENTPLMFHCSAGKDRTGMGAALVLSALGVDENIIIEDYLLSNIYLADKYSKYITQYPALKPLFEVRKEFIESGLNQIKEKYGTVEDFLTKTLNVDINKMRDTYLVATTNE